jgi:hypothetical protein
VLYRVGILSALYRVTRSATVTGRDGDGDAPGFHSFSCNGCAAIFAAFRVGKSASDPIRCE